MEPPMTDCLAALIKRVAKLCQAGLEACHCVKEFHIQQIHPLGHQKTLAFKCPRWPITTTTLQKVIYLSFLHNVDNNHVLI
jgi:hypothetical protein